MMVVHPGSGVSTLGDMRTITLKGPNGPFRCTPRQAKTTYRMYPEIDKDGNIVNPAAEEAPAVEDDAEKTGDPDPSGDTLNYPQAETPAETPNPANLTTATGPRPRGGRNTTPNTED